MSTGIPTIIMVLKKSRSDTNVLIVDASKGFSKAGKNNILRACDIKKIVDVVTSRITVDKFSKVVSRTEIRENEYNLNIPRYVDSSEKTESWDIFSSMYGGIPRKELEELQEYWTAFPSLKNILFSDINSGYYALNTSDLKETVLHSPDVQKFFNIFSETFDDFEDCLTKELLDNMGTLNITGQENILSDNIFARLANIPLIDRYEAYQLLDDDWSKLAVDLEIIQTEGFKAAKQVDPNFVLKKKDGKDQEVQDGWTGHILPFPLVQETLMKESLTTLKGYENRLSEISACYEELLEELPEEEKEKDFVTESRDAFIPSEIKKAIKSRDIEPESLALLKKVDALISEEKSLKKLLKTETAKLQTDTKSKIEQLSDEEVFLLLKQKWIQPLVQSMKKLPEDVISEFIKKLDTLCHKYETTFEEIEQQIRETESTLCLMLDDLTGNEFDMMGIRELRKLLIGGE